MKIKGTVEYIDIGTGCWGIVDAQGNQYRPINFPAQLKTSGMEVTITAVPVNDMSIFMWGEAVRITSFQT